jgi:hypothetical protein
MRLTVVAIIMSGFVASCAEGPTQPESIDSRSVAFSLTSAEAAVLIPEPAVSFNLPLPGIGSCSFIPDEPGQFNNFLRMNPGGSRFLKIEEAKGLISVTPFGGRTWTGTGHLNVNWPNYPAGDSFEMTIVGTVSLGEQKAAASCKDLIVKGVPVETFIKLH